jgi:predicted O-linked N-acetylglucosamine transferase (SPINDLY family)
MWQKKGYANIKVHSLDELRLAYAKAPSDIAIAYPLAQELVRLELHHEAIPVLLKISEACPALLEPKVMLAQAFEKSNQHEAGLHWARQALHLSAGNPYALFFAASCLEKLGQLAEAAIFAEQLADKSGWEVKGLELLAHLHRISGHIEKSIAGYRQLFTYGVDANTYSNYLLLLMSSAEISPPGFLREHQKINELFNKTQPLVLSRAYAAAPRRIGFISADLKTHVVAFFIEKLFELLGHEKFSLHAYSTSNPDQDDEITLGLRKHTAGWRSLYRVPAQAAAEQIAQDEIDILIDLSGHTGGNRMDILAHKPAPVIATWLGYLATTGLTAVDFRIVDAYTDPPGLTEAHHSEQLVRLAHSQWCYVPRATHPPVEGLAALRNGYITFGSVNSFAKISEASLKLWAQLLQQVSNSRLLIAAIPLGQPRQWVTEFFVRQGVAATRLEFLGRTSLQDYMRNYRRIDIALDSFPYNGGTTTCDALYMGVPVLTRAGQHSVARSGVSLMTSVGLPDWVAHSPEEFLAIGAHWAAHLPALAQLRAGLRQQFMASPLGNQALFAQDFERVLHEMWQRKGRATA